MRFSSINTEATDSAVGWKLGTRVLPQRYKITLRKFYRYGDDALAGEVLTEEEHDAVIRGEYRGASYRAYDGTMVWNENWALREAVWLELEVESSPTQPPRCVTLHAPRGIGTPEQRFPLAGIIAEASAYLSSKTGDFDTQNRAWDDVPTSEELDDALFEAKRSRGRKRTRDAITAARLDAVARVARQHPRAPTAAVKAHFGFSRGYARKLIKRAEQAGFETVGRS